MKTTISFAIFALLITLGFVAVPSTPSALAQETAKTTVDVPQNLSSEAISELVSKLDPDQTEALSSLIRLLNNSISDEIPGSGSTQVSTLDTLKIWLTEFGSAVISRIRGAPEMIAGIGRAYASIFDGRGFGGSAVFLALIALAIAAGMAGEWLFNRITAGKREEIRNTKPGTLLETLKTLSTRAAIEIGGVIVFAITALLFIRVILPDPGD